MPYSSVVAQAVMLMVVIFIKVKQSRYRPAVAQRVPGI
jgi:hypothetical protein